MMFIEKAMTSTMAVTLMLALAQPSYAQDRFGTFTYYQNTDDFTDEDRSFISSDAEDAEGWLTWRCDEDGLNIFYIWDSYFGGDRNGLVRVRYRIDQKSPSQVDSWELTTTQRGAWAPMHMVSGITNEALAGKGAVFEVTDPLDGESIRDRFSLVGLQEALSRLPCYSG